MATTHQRTLIRKAIQARLMDRTRAGTRVETTRVHPWKPSELPAISVYTLNDPADADSRQTAPREYRRNLEVKIECALRETEDLDDALDAFELEVRRAIDADPTFKDSDGEPQASDTFLVGTTIVLDHEGDRPIGAAVLTFEVPYYEPAPDAADVQLDDFKTADIRSSLGGAQAPAEQAEDVAALETAP